MNNISEANGLKIQWGVVTHSDTYTSINFPVQFTEPPSVFASPRHNNNDATCFFIAHFTGVSKTSASVRSIRQVGQYYTGDLTPYSWFAIGY